MPYPLYADDRKRLVAAQTLLESSKPTNRLHALNSIDLAWIIMSEVEKFVSTRRSGALPRPSTYPQWIEEAMTISKTFRAKITTLASKEIESSAPDIDLSVSTVTRASSHAFIWVDDEKEDSMPNHKRLDLTVPGKKYIDKAIMKFLEYYFCEGVDLNYGYDKIMRALARNRKKEEQERARRTVNAMKKLHIRDKI